MLKTLALILTAGSVVGLVFPAKAATGSGFASGTLVSDQLIVPVQQRGPGSEVRNEGQAMEIQGTTSLPARRRRSRVCFFAHEKISPMEPNTGLSS
jgi:hypothetical protein